MPSSLLVHAPLFIPSLAQHALLPISLSAAPLPLPDPWIDQCAALASSSSSVVVGVFKSTRRGRSTSVWHWHYVAELKPCTASCGLDSSRWQCKLVSRPAPNWSTLRRSRVISKWASWSSFGGKRFCMRVIESWTSVLCVVAQGVISFFFQNKICSSL